MTAHATTIETVDLTEARVNDDAIGRRRTRFYRWRCNCKATGPNAVNTRVARNGGAKHVAMAGRGKS